MWLRLTATGRLVVLTCLNLLLHNTVTAEVEQTAVLSNISSTVVTEPLLTGYSTVDLETRTIDDLQEIEKTSPFPNDFSSSVHYLISRENTTTKSSNVLLVSPSPHVAVLNSQVGIVKSSDIDMSPSKLVRVSSTASNQETFRNAEKKESQTSNAVLVNNSTVTLTVPTTYSIELKQSSVNYSKHLTSNTTKIEKKSSENVTAIMPSMKSEIQIQMTTSGNMKQLLTISTALETPFAPNKNKNTIFNSTISISHPKSKLFQPNTVINRENTSMMLTSVDKSYTRTEQSLSSFTTISGQLYILANSSVKGREASKTVTLESSPTLIKQLNKSMSLFKHTDVSNSSKQPVQEDTRFMHRVGSSTVKMEVKMTINSTLNPDLSKIKTQKVTKMSTLQNLGNKSSISTQKHNIFFSAMNVSSYILFAPRHTIAKTSTTELDKSKNIETYVSYSTTNQTQILHTADNSAIAVATKPSYVSYSTTNQTQILYTTDNSAIAVATKPSYVSYSTTNQTQILHTTDNSAIAVATKPSSMPTVFDTVPSHTKKIEVVPSVTFAKTFKGNYTVYLSVSPYYTKKDKISSSMKGIQPSSTALSSYDQEDYKATIPSPPPIPQTKLEQQQFSITIKITSESFKNEYLTNPKAFKKKSEEIEDIFNRVLSKKLWYSFTRVLRFFRGSLGCDLIIYTKSNESKPVSVDEIQDTLNAAKSTESGFGKIVVESIEEIDEEGKDKDEEEKEAWGRQPIIVISILGGVCLVLLVVVISQCIQKRHYSHSLAESNEIREYSPNIQLKNNDDVLYKDEERVPMTTFN